MKEKIAYWYRTELWTADMVRKAVGKGLLTKEQYTEITGEAYE